MDDKKRKWLKRHGYKPITAEVIKEMAFRLYEQSPRFARIWAVG